MAHSCEIWVAAVGDEPSEVGGAITPEEVARAGRYRVARHRFGRLLSAAILRRAAGRALTIPPLAVPVRRSCERCGGDHGRPFVPGLEVSVSHCEHLVVVAVTTAGAVGVDVEPVPTSTPMAIARSSVPGELVPFDRPEQALGWWCRKEAMAKALGVGLAGAGRPLQVTAPPSPPLVLSWGGRSAPNYVLDDLDLPEGASRVVGAVAVLAAGPIEVTVRDAQALGLVPRAR